MTGYRDELGKGETFLHAIVRGAAAGNKALWIVLREVLRLMINGRNS